MKTKVILTITLMIFIFMNVNAQFKTYSCESLTRFIIENSKVNDVKLLSRNVNIKVDVESGTIQLKGDTIEEMYKITMVERKESYMGNLKVKSQNGMEKDFDMVARGIDSDNNLCMISMVDYPLECKTCLQIVYKEYFEKYTLELITPQHPNTNPEH